MQALKPWHNRDYIKQARLDDNGIFVLMLVDGGQKVYQVDECTAAQVEEAIELMKKNKVPVLK
jgi:predicted aldo/keto reductase-like oxidoreductase